jgi:hypothetical protein
MQSDPKLSDRAPAKTYTCDHQELSRQRRSILSRHDILVNLQKYTRQEESVLVQYILNLVARGSPPWMSTLEDIYNFDETGFMMGVISTKIVVTRSEGRGRAKKVQRDNREWVTVI